ncbi:MAG: FlgD immunoglobulin-like domain containing protein, partial [Candidatus Poribacteria bacterium]
GKKLKNINVEVKNLGTGMTQTAMANSDGSYVLTFVDFSGNRAGKAGDVLKVRAMDADGRWISRTTSYTLTAEDIRMHHVIIPTIQLEIIPRKSVLLPSYPNPSNPETWIPFRLSRDAEVKIEIYNVAGQLVRTLNLGRKEAGNYISRQRAVHWDGTNDTGETVTSGLYFYTIRAGAFKATRRMVILK